jgi:hypothetical protein
MGPAPPALRASSRRVTHSPLRPFALSPHRPFAATPHPHLPLYTPFLWRQSTHSMEVDFQAIKVEELKSRLGELRRYL